MSTLHVRGNSIAQGSGASDNAHKWATKLGIALGMTVNMQAYGGDMTGDATRRNLYVTALAAGDIAVIQNLENDARIFGTDTTKRAFSKDNLRNEMAWLAFPDKITARAAGGETGSFTDTGIEGIGRRSAAVGAKQTVSRSGTDLFVTMIVGEPAGSFATYSIKIDGGAPQHFSGNVSGITSYNGYAYGNRCHHFSGLADTAHTIEVEQTGAGYMYPQWYAGNDQSAAPLVVVADCLNASSAPGLGYAAWGGSPSAVAGMCTVASDLVAELAAAGGNVRLAGINAAVNDTTDLHPADGLHPGDSGHDKEAVVFETVIVGVPVYTYTDLAVKLRNDGVPFLDIPGLGLKQIQLI